MSRRVARPYAQALFSVLKPHGDEALRSAHETLERVVGAFDALPDLFRVFEAPALAQRQKAELLRAVSRVLEVGPTIHNLLVALQTHYRLRFLRAVAEEFGLLCDRHFGVVRGRVLTAVSLKPHQLAALEQALAGMVNSRVVLEQQEQPELLAGFVVRLGSWVLDGSLKRQLELFAERAAPRGGHYAG